VNTTLGTSVVTITGEYVTGVLIERTPVLVVKVLVVGLRSANCLAATLFDCVVDSALDSVGCANSGLF
jgi:hypothetical protein